jgi:hypothetical protein
MFQLLILDQVVGRDQKDLNIAIVNNDSSYQDCLNSSSLAPRITQNSCEFERLSCLFVDEIDGGKFNKTFYKSSEDAMKDVKKLKTVAIAEFNQNFSSGINYIITIPDDFDEFGLEHLENSYIHIKLDATESRISNYVKVEHFLAYKSFIEKVLKSCGLSKSLKSFGMKTELMFDINEKNIQLPVVMFL